jgi:sterol desaturase/sphingolipid hydroxylase (fatty acid hydroxylase superfamily)
MAKSDFRNNEISGWSGAALTGGTFAALFLLELRRPLRRSVESKIRRHARNFAVASLAAAAVQVVERPVVLPLARLVEARRWGLLKRLGLPVWTEIVVGGILLDYTLYLWHILAHKVPLLWRFHQVHHVDLDLDASTALRFHFGELAFSVVSRTAQVLGFGICPLTLSAWQAALLVEIMFHHSNVELPEGLECWLSRLIVTPRMHGIHHSMVEAETNSNWSSGLTIWDWLHGTLRLDVPQGEIRIGVPAYSNPQEVTLPKLVEMPFVGQRPSWP